MLYSSMQTIFGKHGKSRTLHGNFCEAFKQFQKIQSISIHFEKRPSTLHNFFKKKEEKTRAPNDLKPPKNLAIVVQAPFLHLKTYCTLFLKK